jgi:hypothetical protein
MNKKYPNSIKENPQNKKSRRKEQYQDDTKIRFTRGQDNVQPMEMMKILREIPLHKPDNIAEARKKKCQ